ncbi:pfkb-type carbohydrate kinase family protein [Nannochloropsis oceanica]
MASTHSGSSDTHPKVLGMGVTGIDLLAYVDAYPAPDAKIRTSDFKVQGGGNAGNTLTALSRLGVHAEIFTKVGDDAYGKMIIDELAADGLDTRRVIRKAGISSPFTYVIVDTASQTRTCLHTPSEDMTEEEVLPSLLDGVDFLHLDGRNTLAAIKLARLSRERGIPVMLDAEKDRPHLKELVPLCDFLVTNTAFPKTFTGARSTEEGMAALLSLGKARLIFTTLGADGSMVMGRSEDMLLGGKRDGEDRIWPMPLGMQESTYTCPSEATDLVVIKCKAWPLEPKEVVDTTGAGDAFIAGIIYGLTHSLPIPRMLVLGGYVAAQKLKKPGARAGLPRREFVPREVGLVG